MKHCYPATHLLLKFAIGLLSLFSISAVDLQEGNEETAVALYAWKAKKDTHLSFKKGDVIAITEKEEMWWSGELDGRVSFSIPTQLCYAIVPLVLGLIWRYGVPCSGDCTCSLF